MEGEASHLEDCRLGEGRKDLPSLGNPGWYVEDWRFIVSQWYRVCVPGPPQVFHHGRVDLDLVHYFELRPGTPPFDSLFVRQATEIEMGVLDRWHFEYFGPGRAMTTANYG